MDESKHELTDFHASFEELLRISGVSKKAVATWLGVDPSTVTRWSQGVMPSDPRDILRKLRPYIEQARQQIRSSDPTEVPAWAPLVGDLDPGIRDYVTRTGLMAGKYHVVYSWIPSSLNSDSNEIDVVTLKYFEAVWGVMGHRTVNVGDQAQVVSVGDTGAPQFDQAMSLREGILSIDIDVDEQVGRRLAWIRAMIDLESFKYKPESIGFLGDLGYRYRVTRAIVGHEGHGDQTNDFLGAPIVLPCRRLSLIVCIPKSCHRGSPSALSYSNRSMLGLLMKFDNADPDRVESLLWPRGGRYEMTNAPDAPLKSLHRVAGTIEALPGQLQHALDQPIDLARPEQTIKQVMCSADSACYLLDLHEPHPASTNTIVWRLAHAPVSNE